jgi:hypothetical protein
MNTGHQVQLQVVQPWTETVSAGTHLQLYYGSQWETVPVMEFHNTDTFSRAHPSHSVVRAVYRKQII